MRYQRGIGIVEVMVALLLLAVAVLGFAAMQMRAVKATDETLYRSDTMVAIRNIAEDIRLHPTADYKSGYLTVINNYSANSALTPTKDCTSDFCNTDEQRNFNAFQSVKLARASEIALGAFNCPTPPSGAANTTPTPKELQKICLVAAWGDTKADMLDNADSCTNKDGVYKQGSTCFVMETY